MITRPIIIPEINNQNSICDYLFQTAKVLSTKGYPTFIYFTNFPVKIFQKPLKKINPRLTHFYPIQIIPFNRFKTIQKINIILSLNLLWLYCFFRYQHRPWYWFFYPQNSFLIKHSLKPKYLNYDILDFFTSPDTHADYLLTQNKSFLLQKANLVTAISNSLRENYQKIKPRTKIHIVPQGFRLINPGQKLSNPTLDKLKKLHNRVGYIGAINNRLNFPLLFELTKNTPKINYIFIGPIGYDTNVSKKPVNKLSQKLFSLKNVYHIDTIPKDQIKHYIDAFDIATIPYDIKDDFNRLSYPMKIFEYFAAGKPTISTPIKELSNFPGLIKTENSAAKWAEHIRYFLIHPLNTKQKKEAKTLSKNNSWKNKINKIIALAEPDINH